MRAAVVVTALVAMTAAATGNPRDDSTGDRLGWWREARFGLFIHWGLYAVPAGQWNGETNHAEWIRHTAQIPIAEYDRLVDRFNPVLFDADEWCRLATNAGMKYIVITSKHHDGFCLWESAETGYDVMSTPFRRDILAELSDACARHGLRLCFYHSIMDWHHPDYLPRRGWERGQRPEGDAEFDRYLEYLRAQVTELLTGYGPIGVMWFDGEWEHTWTHAYGEPLYDLCRNLQPKVIVNDRVDKGRQGHTGRIASGFAGDYGTPEQNIPGKLPGEQVDWETCMTMNRHWGYNRHDRDYKSTQDLVRKLVDIASKGGNFLLNVGPTADGEFPVESVERLEAIGAWMAVHGEAIHGTSASPFGDLPWGRCTAKGSGDDTVLYLHVFDWPADGRLRVPGIGNASVSARVLGGTGPRPVTRQDSDLLIDLPPTPPNAICPVLRLEVTGAPIVYRPPIIEAVCEEFVESVVVTMSPPSPGVEIHYTLDGENPGAGSPRFEAPLTLTGSATIRARFAVGGRLVSGIVERTFRKVAPIAAVSGASVRPGLRRRVYLGEWDALPDFAGLEPVSEAVVTGITLDDLPQPEYLGLEFRGYLEVPGDDVYRFLLTSDDGSRLRVAGRVLVDNDGLHGTEQRTGTIPLAAGRHEIVVTWFNKTGGAELSVECAPTAATPTPLDASALSH